MRPLSLLFLGSAALLCAATPGRAASLSCVSINGQSVCSSSGSLACQNVNGRMSCVEGPRGRELQPVPPLQLPAPDRRDGGISVEQHGQTLHIHNGTVDLTIE